MNTHIQPKLMALVTGASGGIGEACARELHAHGCQIIIHYGSNKEKAIQLNKALPESIMLQADLSNETEMDELVTKIKALGGVDILVNNAGMTIDAPFLMTNMSNYEKVFNVNLKSTFLLTKKLVKGMIRKKGGRIINISSVVGITGNAGQSVYGMTKSAIINLTKTLSVELAPYNILVNAVAPGFIQTEMTNNLPPDVVKTMLKKIPLNKLGEPKEIGKMVRFLALEANYCTGTVFHVNGGMYGD
ncbi:MAG: SDR family oxidoreductase [Legionellales bacterium]|nr:SDR family oxidoreductase [Legionellales bacterium]